MIDVPEARSVRDLGRGFRAREFSVEENLDATLDAIRSADSDDPPLHAFLSVADAEGLRAEARALDEAFASGADPGPLAGIPVAIKDNIAVRDVPTTCGSRMLRDFLPAYEATAVRRLRAAGALVIGKTNMDEFAMGSSTENSAFGPTRNPWDPSRVAGGSSGGSAAAVAAGLVPLALGSDTGGSVRQPAAFNGIVGIKPTYGRISRYGLVAFASSFDQIGTFGRTVEDAGRLLAAVAGHDPRDSTSNSEPFPRLDTVWEADPSALKEIVVGVPDESAADHLQDAVRERVELAVERMQREGAEVREVSLPHVRYAIPAYHLVATAEACSNLARYDGVRFGFRAENTDDVASLYRRTRGEGFGPEVKRRIVLGTFALSAGYHEEYYERGQRVRRLIARDFQAAFGTGVDVIVMPTAPSVAFRFGERLRDPVRMYLSDIFTVPANLAGLPALSLPTGRVDGMPVGTQLIARKMDESTMLRAAHALEASIRARPLDAETNAG